VPLLSHLTPCTPTKSNLYLANTVAAAASERALYRPLTFQVPNLMYLFCCLNWISRVPRLSVSTFCNKIRFYDEELLAPCPTPKLENHPLSAVHDCLFTIFVATHHIGDRSSICNLRKSHAMATGTHLPRPLAIHIKSLLRAHLV